MSISVGSDAMFQTLTQTAQSTSKTSKLENSLVKDVKTASDEELMESCKSFENYLVEQVMKQVKNTIAKSDDDENEYMSYFGDMLYQSYAKDITESGQLGIAKQLYEAMKRDQNT
ncbi:rod-binding protein [Lachnoclostridium phytofermentans]|uniref:Flagellar protein FlgJ N-terminal domain-containing protein n=1 Tax=Lachnoclostridium phytofermentans (strain ATCC 700394 / DSM 18823 / ISDg) TaxID=357809 RepID=A9KS01_LACP7|nr:rod-binding protein [Lachnoclostridium phytofermentans]ABX40632.1 hypothetical protein Cphy_0245 [Lachnoclostridium phytofermentans ISDg]